MVIYSKYQEAIFNEIEFGTQNLVVKAGAGSGKTFSAIECLKRIPSGKNVVYLAFNKHNADELVTKVPKGSEVKTTHSLGLSILITNNFVQRGQKPDGLKVYKLFDTQVDPSLKSTLTKKEYNVLRTSVVKTVDTMRNGLVMLNDPEIDNIINHLIKFYSITIPEFVSPTGALTTSTVITKNDYISLIKKVYKASALQKSIINFDDMIFLPALYNLKPAKLYDFVFVDEAQDLNPCQARMLLNILSPSGRVIIIGDENQSMYGFRMADVDSMQKLAQQFNAKELPLSICYRCPKSHIALANKFVPELEPSPTAIEGEIFNIMESEIVSRAKIGDLILCRNNAPLISICLKFIRNGIKANIKGADLGTTLITLIEDFNMRNISDMLVELKRWEKAELERCDEFNINPQNTLDKVACIKELAENSEASTIPELVKYIREIFSESKGEIELSSVHKAKGLEADNVFIVYPHLMPSPYAFQEWEQIQERNIEYVALTRAKKTLTFVHKEA